MTSKEILQEEVDLLTGILIKKAADGPKYGRTLAVDMQNWLDWTDDVQAMAIKLKEKRKMLDGFPG